MELFNEKANVLVLESSKMYREVIRNLQTAIEEDNDNWVFSDNDSICKKNKIIHLVYSPFLLNFEERKIQRNIIDELYKVAIDEQHYTQTQKLLSELEAYLLELDLTTECNAKVNIADFQNILKIAVSGVDISEEFVERMDEYIKILSRLIGYKVIIFVGIQDYFLEEEWRNIEKIASYENIYLLCIEKNKHFTKQNEVIIDSDGCRVV